MNFLSFYIFYYPFVHLIFFLSILYCVRICPVYRYIGAVTVCILFVCICALYASIQASILHLNTLTIHNNTITSSSERTKQLYRELYFSHVCTVQQDTNDHLYTVYVDSKRYLYTNLRPFLYRCK